MRICRFDDDRLGVVIGGHVHDVSAAQDEIRASAPYAMMGDAVIAALPAWRTRLEGMAAAAPGKPLSQVQLLAPVARPSKVMAAPTNYRKHIEEMRAVRESQAAAPSRFPSDIGQAGIFLKANSALVGPSEGIKLRFPDRRNDHEVELVLVIGRQGSDIPRDQALDYVAGYCLGLDMTVRGPEDRSFRKSCDGYAVLGPWMATADEIENPDDVPLSLSVNDQLRQSTSTRDLIYDVRRLIEFASSFYTLHPGDIYYTGTPDGVGPVKPGDWIRATSAAPLGELRVQVRAHDIARSA
jgi:2-keto-4-pentenoate hydratase/2-oxohepta-3-ene-1,7-dioic acid hydratase in catechol pathway